MLKKIGLFVLLFLLVIGCKTTAHKKINANLSSSSDGEFCPLLSGDFETFIRERVDYESQPGQVTFSYQNEMPTYHIDNPSEGLPTKGSVWELPDVPLIEIVRDALIPVKYRSAGNYQEIWNVKQRAVSGSETFIEFISPGGFVKYLKIDSSKGYFLATEIDFTETSLKPPPKYQPSPELHRRTFSNLSTEEKQEAFDHLVRILAEASNITYTRQDLVDDIKAGVQDMITVLESGKPLTTTDLERWNLRDVRKIVEAEVGNKPLPAGIIRGSKKSVTWQGKNTLVDTTDLQMFNSDGCRTTFHYIPSEQVPLRVFQLLQKISNLSENSTFRDLAEIYKEFITIHPFVDGNGRASRMTVAFSLLKMGFIPSGVSEIPREALYSSIDELASSMEERFLGQQY